MPNKVSQKLNNNTRLKDFALLFAIPVAIAILAAIVIYTPRLLANPQYDFIYSVCNDYRCANSYSVDSAGYVAQDPVNTSNSNFSDRTADLRYYDTANDATRRLTLEEARRYHLNTSSKSLDGYALARENRSSGFLFWGDYDEGWYLKDGSRRKKVELTITDSSYSQDIKFLGWINQ